MTGVINLNSELYGFGVTNGSDHHASAPPSAWAIDVTNNENNNKNNSWLGHCDYRLYGNCKAITYRGIIWIPVHCIMYIYIVVIKTRMIITHCNLFEYFHSIDRFDFHTNSEFYLIRT